jgi:hypothetical protein
MPRDDQHQPGSDYIEAEDNNLRIRIAEWGFRALFAFFGTVASVLGLLSAAKDRR